MKAIYLIIFQLYKIYLQSIVKLPIKHVWYRNSLRLNYWSFGRSDIDITIIVNQIKNTDYDRIVYHHNIFKKFFLIIGEVVFFDIKDESFILDVINSLELKRDPDLINFLNIENLRISEIDRIIFLTKFIHANYNSLKDNKVRENKLNFFLKQVSPESIVGSTNQLNALVGICSKKMNSKSAEKLKELFEFTSSGSVVSRKEINFSEYPKEYLCVLFNFIGFHIIREPLTPMQQELLWGCLKWELWGIYSYRHFAHSRLEINSHIHKILENSKPSLTKKQLSDLLLLRQGLGFK